MWWRNFPPDSGSRSAPKAGKETKEFEALVRIDTPQEALYYANGGILQYVLRQLLANKTAQRIIALPAALL